jgi:hypothetical protein
MKKVYPVMVALFSMPFVVMTACNNSPSKKSRTQLLTQASWKIEKAGIDKHNKGTVDIIDTSFVNPRNKEDTYIFQPDGSGAYNEGEIKIKAGGQQTQPFNWQFTSDETKLVLGLDTADVLSIDDHSLKIYYEENNSGKGSERYLAIFKH